MATHDARISTALPGHPKTKKLAKRLGLAACWHLVCLFLWTAANRSDGSLAGMTDEDVELAADWTGADGALVAALRGVGFIDGDEGTYVVHDWAEHNPWAAGAPARAEKSRFAALCKQHGRREATRMMPDYAERLLGACESGPTGTPDAVPERASGALLAESGSAPSPFPLQSPSPSPKQEQKDIGAGAPESDAEKPPTGKAPAGARAKTSGLGINALLAEGVNQQHAEDWLKVRKAKRMPLTTTAWESTKSEAAKSGITPAEAVRIAAERGWSGFMAEYLKNANAPPGRRNSTDAHFEGIAEKFANYNGPTVSLL
jgi:hypothetical protein